MQSSTWLKWRHSLLFTEHKTNHYVWMCMKMRGEREEWNKGYPSWTLFLRRTLLAFSSLLWGLYTHSPLASHSSRSTILPSFFLHTAVLSLPFPAPSTFLAIVATQLLFITRNKMDKSERGGGWTRAAWEEMGRREWVKKKKSEWEREAWGGCGIEAESVLMWQIKGSLPCLFYQSHWCYGIVFEWGPVATACQWGSSDECSEAI